MLKSCLKSIAKLQPCYPKSIPMRKNIPFHAPFLHITLDDIQIKLKTNNN